MFSNELIVNILNYIETNLYKQISIDELSRYYSYNKDYIMRLFKREIHCTIIQYIQTKRVFNSLESLKIGNTILNISLNYGFSSQEYYCEIFNKIMGVSPTTFRKFIRNDINVSINDIINIQDHVSNINYFINKVERYKSNIKPKDTIKILSIFK